MMVFLQSGVCGCEKGYTEVMTTHGFLDYCTRTPGVDSNKKADVKTNSGRLKPGPSQAQDLFSEWTLRPVGPGTEMENVLRGSDQRVCEISRAFEPGGGYFVQCFHWA